MKIEQGHPDTIQTLRNRALLKKNVNLLFWYQQLYTRLFGPLDLLNQKQVLEVGSGTSPLKHFCPNIKTSDVMELDYVDYVFDCHNIHQLHEIPDGSLDVITVTNVLHHLRNPLQFLTRAACKLKSTGSIVLTEPYYSTLSSLIYKLLHHEPADFSISSPLLDDQAGPLAAANMALPHLLFFVKREWLAPLEDVYSIGNPNFYTSISYMATGGISHRIPIPHGIYRFVFRLDDVLTLRSPQSFASFFSCQLKKL